MKAGDRAETPIFGEVILSAVYETETEARAGGYYLDAHMKTGADDAEWKLLYNGDAFAAVRCKIEGMEKRRRPARKDAPAREPEPTENRPEPTHEKPTRPGQICLWDL